jgi:hypothetical protein
MSKRFRPNIKSTSVINKNKRKDRRKTNKRKIITRTNKVNTYSSNIGYITKVSFKVRI